jgi:hypothetical protein
VVTRKHPQAPAVAQTQPIKFPLAHTGLSFKVLLAIPCFLAEHSHDDHFRQQSDGPLHLLGELFCLIHCDCWRLIIGPLERQIEETQAIDTCALVRKGKDADAIAIQRGSKNQVEAQLL